MLHRPTLLLCGVVCAIGLGATAASALSIHTLAINGAPLPGQPAESFVEPRMPRISSNGRTTFAASDSTSSLSDGLWVADAAGALTAVHPAGTAMPGAGGALLFTGTVEPLVSGGVGVMGQLDGAGVDDTNRFGFWRWGQATGLALVAREGGLVADTNGAVIADPNLPAWTPSTLVFRANLEGGDATPDSDEVLLRSGPTETSVVLREGQAAPGLPGEIVKLVAAFPFDGDEGDVLALANLASGSTAFYRMDGAGSLALLFRSDDPVPGFPGATLNGFGVGVTSFATDEIAFSSSVQLPVFDPIDEGIWRVDAAGDLHLIAREGGAVGEFRLFAVEDARPSLADDGRIVFEANALDANFDVFSSIVLHDPNKGLEIVARVDSAIPGVLDATFFGFFRDPQIDSNGEIAFYGGISTPGVPGAEAIFVRRSDGTFVVIAQGGQPFEVSPGVFKTVENVHLPNSPSARFLSDDGRLTFSLDFTDRTSGVFLAILPEPCVGVLGLCTLGVASAARITRARRRLHRL